MQLMLKKVSEPIIKVFRLVGLWPENEANYIYWIYGLLNMSIFSFLFTTTMMIQLVAFTDLTDLTETMYMSLTEFALSFKILNFLIHLRSMQDLLVTIRIFRLNSNAEKAHYNKRLKLLYTLLMLDFSMTNVAHLFTVIKILLDSRRLLAFPAWFPFNWVDNTPNYIIAFIYELIGMGITSNVQVVIGMYSNLMFCMISTQFEILSMRLRSIGHETAETKTIENRMETTEALKYCVKVHHEILEFAEKVERNFTFPTFIQICISGIVICSLANEAARTNDPVKQISFGTTLSIMALQIFFPCYLGNNIVATSNDLPTEMYKSNWIRFNRKEKQIVSIFLERTKRNSNIVVGNLFILNLQTFSSIINVAYRLLAVIRNI